MAEPNLNGQIPFFLQNFLGKPASALPKGAQWVLVFEGKPGDYTGVIPVAAIKKGVSFEPQKWNIDKSIEVALSQDYQQTKGCMFVQAVQVPGESVVVNPVGLQQNGYLQTPTGEGRNAYTGMQIVFLDTNVSFVDNVIRPWTIATAHLGMIARSGADNYRCDFSLYRLGFNPNAYVAQRYTFINACPISIDGEEYNYSPVTSPTNRNTTFSFQYYTIDSVTGNQSLGNIPDQLPLSTRERNVNKTLP